jgi:flagellar basal-body rod protein FlgB
MGITDIPILSMLRTRLDWSQARQRILADNVANADTPNFRGRDLAPLKFDDPPLVAPNAVSGVTLTRTASSHMEGVGLSQSPFPNKNAPGYEVRPAGNAVNLEEEMMKVAANQMDHQAAISLYSRSMGLLKTAIGKR